MTNKDFDILFKKEIIPALKHQIKDPKYSINVKLPLNETVSA